jgi:hypothetical protein
LLHSEHQVPKTDNITGRNIHCIIYKEEENNIQSQTPSY